MKQADKEKFLEQNAELLFDLKESGYFNPEDLEVVFDSKAPYQQKSDAFKRVLGGVNEIFSRKDLPAELKEQGKKWKETYEKEMSFKPSIDDWKEYDPNQMSELAESLGYNWANTDDRSKMLKGLTDYSIKKDRQESWKNYAAENPIASFLAKHIVAPSTVDALEKGEDVENKDVISDVVNYATFALPGFGASKTIGGRALKMLGGAGIEEVNNILQNYAQDKDLINAADVIESLAVGGMGATTDAVPKAAKMIGDKMTEGSIGKGAGNVIEDALNYATGTTKGEQRKAAEKAVAEIDDYLKFSDALEAGNWTEADKIARKYGTSGPKEYAELGKNKANEILQKEQALKETEALRDLPMTKDKALRLEDARKAVADDDYYKWAQQRLEEGKSVKTPIRDILQTTTKQTLNKGTKATTRKARDLKPKQTKTKPISSMVSGSSTVDEIIESESPYWESGMRPWSGGQFTPMPENIKNTDYGRAYQKWLKDRQ